MNQMQAGFARLDITPQLGVHMSGYFFERLAEGVLDPLYVNALALKDGDRTVVVLACDLAGISLNRELGWDETIANRAGISMEQLFIHCTHTHTGPICCGRPGSDDMYDAWLLRRMGDAAVMAVADCKPVVEMRVYEGDLPNTTFSRRFKMKGGHFQTWANWGDPDIVGLASQPDESLRLVRICREEGPELVLVNFQSHPDNVSGNLYSADFPGFVRTNVEEARKDARCIFFNGAEGQLIADDYRKTRPTQTPAIRYAYSRNTGRKIADFVLAHMEEAEPFAGTGVSFAQTRVPCKTKRDSARVPEAQRLVDLHEAGKDDEIGPDWVCTPLVAEAYKLIALEEAQLDEVPLLISAVSFGGLAFAGIAGEPFCELGKEIRERSPFPVTLFCSCANGYGDYFPTAEAFDQDGYEPRNCRFAKGVGEHLMEAVCDLLQSL